MNKGIIMEINGDYAIALNDTGIFDKILRKENMKVGQKIFYFEDDLFVESKNLYSKPIETRKPIRHYNFMKTFGSIAALFVLIFTFFQGISTQKAYAVVSLDINPSIQIEIDNKKTIIKVEGVNDDGKNIDFSGAVGENINEGIVIIKDKLVESKYLDDNHEVLVAFALVKNKEDSNYEEKIQEAIQTTFKTENVTYVKGNKEAVQEAKTKGISLGRYEASLSADGEIKNNIEKAPVKEITALIKDKENVIHWEAEDVKPETSVNETQSNEKPQQNNEKPALEKPADKPSVVIPSTPIDSPKDTNVDGNKKPTIDEEPEDGGILEVPPEVQTPPNGQIENPNPPESGKEENDETLIPPSDGTLENNTANGKDEETESIPQSTSNKDKINK